ncbi:mucoidy inhibitor MuiA family protein [Allocoleopsis franciscana]|nr:mucoidy inhibitor MuiA family protein [Allocoleopsis franciscana]
MSDDKTPSVYEPLTSRIDKVKVYAAGATVTRVADLQLDAGEIPEQVEMAGLPLALDDSSVRVRVESALGASTAIATDVRIGLAVPPRQAVQNSPTDEEVREAKAEVQQLEDAIALIENEIAILYQLDVPERPDGEEGKAPPPSPLTARLALTNFKDEQVRARITEKRETTEKLRQAQEHLDDLLQKQARASNAKEVRPHELRKTVVVRLSNEGEPSTLAGQRLVVEYFVPGARWTPTYICRLDSTGNQATVAVRALICQRTGEDWSGVSLELSTAEPLSWCELPELPSLRLGRAQPRLKTSGWRLPPVGAEILFEDFDRQKQVAISAVSVHSVLTDIPSPSVPPLPNLAVEVLKHQGIDATQVPKKMSQSPLDTQEIFERSQELRKASFSQQRRRQRVELTTDEPSAPRDEFDITLMSPGMIDAGEYSGYAESMPAAAPAVFRSPSRPKTAAFHESRQAQVREEEDALTNLLAYSLMRMGAADEPTQRGKLSIEQRQEVYLEILKRRNVVVSFNVLTIVQQAAIDARNCIYINLPPGGINVRQVAGSFDYAYSADGRIDVPSDGEFHSVALTSNSTDVDLRYVVVPREDTNVFRIAQLKNPLQAPLLAGPADVYVDGEYILSTKITTVPPKGQMELGLGVEQAIKVARNTSYQEVRSGETLVAFNELRHNIQIDIANRLPRDAAIEVRERIPIPDADAKVDVQIDRASPEWEKYEQQERGIPIRGGYRWRVQVPGGEQTKLSVQYTIKTFVDSELIGGNRRE